MIRIDHFVTSRNLVGDYLKLSSFATYLFSLHLFVGRINLTTTNNTSAIYFIFWFASLLSILGPFHAFDNLHLAPRSS